MSETYLFDGTDVESLTGVRIAGYEGLYDTPELRGEDPSFAGLDGVLAVLKPFGVGTFTLPLSVLADSLAERNDALRSLTRLFALGRTVQCTRRRDFTAGPEDHVATVRYLSGLAPADIQVNAALLAVTFEVLDGVWLDSSTRSYSIVTTAGGTLVSNPGDVPARRIILTLPSAGSLTTGDGQRLDVSGATTVDVLNQTATGGVTVTPYPNSNGSWLQIPTSTTAFHWSGTSAASLTYYPAYV